MLPCINNYQASINGDREITANTEMDSLAKLAARPTAQSLHKRSSRGSTDALCNREISKNQMVRAGNCNILNKWLLHPCWPLRCRSPTKPNLKHVSIKILPPTHKIFLPGLRIGIRVIAKYASSFNIKKKKIRLNPKKCEWQIRHTYIQIQQLMQKKKNKIK